LINRLLQPFQEPFEFRVRKPRGYAEVLPIPAVGAEGGDDPVLFQPRVQLGHGIVPAEERDHGDGIFGQGGGLQDGAAFFWSAGMIHAGFRSNSRAIF
jgi:hypothetical protein